MENKKNSRIGGERGRVKTDFDMTHLIPSKENKKQTAVEWLIDWMEKNQYFIGNDLLQAVGQAIQMEKEQIVNAYHTGTSHEYNSVNNGKEYYEKYYGK